MKHHIGVDPGHSSWAIWYEIDDVVRKCDSSKEKPHMIGCPELASKLLEIVALYPPDDSFVICIEEAFGDKKHIIKNNLMDIGYLQRTFEPYKNIIFWTCSQSDWKTHLKGKGYPIHSGMKPEIYTSALNKHLNITLTEHEWAAWGIREYSLHSGVE